MSEVRFLPPQPFIMKTKLLTDINEVKEAALDTIGKKPKKPTSEEWLYQILYAEHSPIRNIVVKGTWKKIKYWVSMHFVRHKVGIEHFVKTQRSDRTGIDRNAVPQGTDVSHSFVANAQAIINISRKRLCMQSSKETREKWLEFLADMDKQLKPLKDLCVPECIYRGFCPELKPCGYSETETWKIVRNIYTNRCKKLQRDEKK